jgi:hypothetical protein
MVDISSCHISGVFGIRRLQKVRIPGEFEGFLSVQITASNPIAGELGEVKAPEFGR